MTESSQRLLAGYAATMMPAYGTPRLALAAGSGCTVVDVDGRSYLDLMAGIAVNALGHAHPAVVETLRRQASRLGHVSNVFATRPQVALAERLLDLLGGGDGRVFFTNSGAEANEAAFKLTRLTGRPTIVAAEGGFHGRTMGALGLPWSPAARAPFGPLPADVRFVPYGDADALRATVDETTAAILLEPIQGEAGVVTPPLGYLAAARSIADESGALLWFDEVQTGIGRTGQWFAFQDEGARPDVITLAKGLGGGIPIGACIALGAGPPVFSAGQHGSTFGGTPLATAVALTVLDVIETDGLLARATDSGTALRAVLAGLPGVCEVRGRGLLLGARLETPFASRAAAAALTGGVIVNDCKPDVIRVAPPLVLGDAEVATARRRLADAWATLETSSEEVA
jgi:acetylornithine/N-succinyldiaminopimelate aminotransferase